MIPVVDSASKASASKVRLWCIIGSCVGLAFLGDLRALDAEPGLESREAFKVAHAKEEPETNLANSDDDLDSEDLFAASDADASNQVPPARSMRSIISCGLLLLVMFHNVKAMFEESSPKDKKSQQAHEMGFRSVMQRMIGKSQYLYTNPFVLYSVLVIAVISGYICSYKILAARGSKMSRTDWCPFFSVVAEGLAILSLRSRIRNSGHAQGISAKTVALFAMLYADTAIDCPAMNARQLDVWACKVLEWVSLVLVLEVLYSIVVTHRQTYQKELDVVPVKIIVLVCAFIAFIYRPCRVNNQKTTMGFAFRIYVDTFAFVPQVVMMCLQDQPVHAPIANFVAVSAVGRIVDMVYWMDEFHFWSGPFQVSRSGWLIVGLHAASLCVVADFFYYYVKTWIAGRGFMEDVAIPSAMDV